MIEAPPRPPADVPPDVPDDPTTETPESFPPILRVLVDLRDRQIQKSRIAFTNRLAAIERGADPTAGKNQTRVIARYAERFANLEAQIDEDIRELVAEEPIYAQVIKIRGIGPMLAAKLLALIDITNKESASQLWRFAGYGVTDGHAERRVQGEPLHYSQRLKTTVFLVGESFIKSRSPYKRIYDEAKPQYQAAHPDWTPLHVHRAAHRKMVKHFMVHLWQRWRGIEGLPAKPLYVLTYGLEAREAGRVDDLGQVIGPDGKPWGWHPHDPSLDPEAFGWP